MGSSPDHGRGAYGFRMEGLQSPTLVDAAPGWPSIHITTRVGEVSPEPSRIDPGSAWIAARTRWGVAADRERRTAEFVAFRELDPEEIVHPLMVPPAAVFACWDGNYALHAGAFVTDAGAWAIIGPTQRGKSSTLAAIALRDQLIVADDLLIFTPDGNVLAGPRSLDLRPETAARLNLDSVLSTVRDDSRYRLPLPPVESAIPLRGWFELDWGDEVALERLRPDDRLRYVVAHRGWGWLAPDQLTLLALAALPAWRLTRPQTWQSEDEAIARLLAVARA